MGADQSTISLARNDPSSTNEVDFLLSWRAHYADHTSAVSNLRVDVGRGKARREFIVSRDLFVHTSPSFGKRLDGGDIDRRSQVIRLEDDDPDTFLALVMSVHPIVRYRVTDATVVELSIMADKYEVVQTLDACEKRLLSPFCDVTFGVKMLLADRVVAFKRLRTHCLQHAKDAMAMRVLKESPEWELLSAKTRRELLENFVVS